MESKPEPASDQPNAKARWENRYETGDTPWDTGRPSAELAAVLDRGAIQPCRAIELGCGTGTNAVYLAQRGFAVTAVDLSAAAIERARRRAFNAAVAVDFLVDDVCDLRAALAPFDFVFDRGCYHCARRENLPGFLKTLERVTKPGAKYLLLAGNANEPTEAPGPPRVHEHEIRAELGGLFSVDSIRPFRFEDPGGAEGPLGWSCLLTRRG
ncbi:MAG TPA: methyltransferase domain-containing protein [Pirellulales bacterium]|nr:methyltransferase domain-containing protein [Pirellulales bacterium]